jgi:D-3-phosphoglycerate dehydrogenase
MNDKPKVLVKEKIADAGIELLREQFDVELGLDWDGSELEDRISEFDGILIRSATKLTPDLIERAGRLKVIGRAGTGVDNVAVEAATKRGIVVANAPEANAIAAAEHTMALMLALCRNIPQAHASLAGGAWDRGKFKGAEDRSAGRGASPGLRHAGDRLRQVRHRGALPRAWRRGHRRTGGALRPLRLHHPAPAQDQ